MSSATGSRGRSFGRPRTRPKLATGMLRISPAAQAIGAAKASAAQAIDTTQPPTPRLSTGTFASVQAPGRKNPTHGDRAGGRRPEGRAPHTPAMPNTRPANTTPPAACQAQLG